MRCVILFRTHTWDDFILRQYEKVRDSSPFDVVILANNTGGMCPPIDGLPFVTFEFSDFEKMGLASGIKGDGTWYNADYPLYYYAKKFPDYDYYIIWEYDVVVRPNIGALMEQVVQHGHDVVAQRVDDPFHDCDYIYSIDGVYSPSLVEKTYFPLAVFSKKAVDELFARRLRLSKRLHSGEIKFWPHAELFMGTELRASELSVAQFSSYGAAKFLSHYPPIFEEDLSWMSQEQFIHPVLDAKRYVESVIRYEGRPERYLNPSSAFHKTLRRFPFSLYRQSLFRAFQRRFIKVSGICKTKIISILSAREFLQRKLSILR